MICVSGESKSRVLKAPGCGVVWSEEKSKIARRCGEKRVFKCLKHVRFGALFEVQMSKNCTPLWQEAHFQVKMHKKSQVRSTF